ncbi:MAG: hypothetical protein Q9181_004788, partial [Wetmoreana brouardii]
MTYADAISAKEPKRPRVPIQQMMKLYTSPAGPPLVNPREKTLVTNISAFAFGHSLFHDWTYENRPSHVAIN